MGALSGMKQITQYVSRSESTVLNFIRDLDFPAKKLGGIWESDTELVDQWRKDQVNGVVRVVYVESEPEKHHEAPVKRPPTMPKPTKAKPRQA